MKLKYDQAFFLQSSNMFLSCHPGHRHDLTRAHKLPCETIHLVIVILAAHRNKIFPRHGAASHPIHNAEGHAYGQTFPVADQMTR